MSLHRCAAALLGLASVCLSGVARAEPVAQCGMSPAREAFDVQGLKSELMVTALSCGGQDRYNAFVAKFRPDLTAQERELKTYFDKEYGRSAQKEHDNYITQLANVQSERGLQAGTQFCDQRISMFDEVLALENASDLGGYAEAKDIVQPDIYKTCETPGPEHAARRVRHGRAVRHGVRRS